MIILHGRRSMIYVGDINPLTPTSDSLLLSFYNVTFELHIKVTRVKENDHQPKKLLILNKFSLSAT